MTNKLNSKIRNWFFVIAPILVHISTSSFSQGNLISGPTEVLAGSTQTYSCPNCLVMFQDFGGKQYWAVTNGTITTNIYNNNSVTVQWSSTPGTGTIAWRNSSMILTQKTVNIGTPPSTPPTPILQYECVQGRLIFNGTPPSGVTWYWQSTSTGTSMTNSSSEWVVTTPNNYYLRAKNSFGWSSAATINYQGTDPELPPAPITISAERCSTGSLTLSSNSTTDRWYTAATGGTSFHTGSNYTTSFNTNTTYYVEAVTFFGCKSSSRTAVTATIYPTTNGGTLSSGVTVFGSATGTLTLSDHTGTIQKWQKRENGGVWVDFANTQTTFNYNVNTSTTFRAVVKSGICTEATSTETSIIVQSLPAVNATATNVVMGQPVTLDGGDGYSSYTWKRNSVTVGTNRYYTTSTPGTYTVTVTKAGVTGSGTSAPYTLHSQLGDLNVNYIVTNRPQRPVKDLDSLSYLDADQLQQTVQYFDGLGRLMQTVQTQSSPSKKDIVQPIVYDMYGREIRKYLPVTTDNTGRYKNDMLDASGNYTGAVQDFYNNPATKIAPDTHPFTETVLESSPLNRPLKQGAPGVAWQPNNNPALDHSVKFNYELNTADDSVLLWKYNLTTRQPENGTGSIREYYSAGRLHKTITLDEHNNKVITFTDIFGEPVLKKVQYEPAKYACTYYVYDETGNESCVIPPEATKRLDTDFFIATADKESFLKAWTYRYRYDFKNRLVEKQLPGAQPYYTVYDKRDRIVFTQDGNQRNLNQWTFTKYDRYNRPIIVGLYTHNASISQDSMQVVVNQNMQYGNQLYEEFTVIESNGYTNRVFPTNNSILLAATYYDNYDFKSLIGGSSYEFMPDHLPGQETDNFKRLQGKVTGAKTNILGSNRYLWTISYYDKKYRVIQVIAQNHKDSIDLVTNRYDFVKLVESKTTHNTTTISHSIKRRLSYDHALRIQNSYHQLDNEPEVITSRYIYNELGQLVTKRLH
jgi:hypothetical protein